MAEGFTITDQTEVIPPSPDSSTANSANSSAEAESTALQGRTGQPERTPKDLILDAAQKLIAQHGYAGFSMRELAEMSGLAKGTIYYHFQDKRQIYLCTVERDMERVESRLRAAIAPGETAVDKLRLLIECHLTLADERRSMILALLREISNMSEEIQTVTLQNNAKMAAPVIEILEEGIAQGIFRPVDVPMATMSLFGTMHTYITWHMILGEQPLDPTMSDKILSFLLNGLLAK